MNTQIEKEFEINQPINIVWKSLADPTDIVTCVPGATITEKIDEKNYKGKVVTKFGPVKAKYAGDIAITELDEANYKMVLKGRGLDSKGKGSADMIMNGSLLENDGKTKVKFSMDITIVGVLAQFGSRLIHDVSNQLLNQFIDNFRNKLATVPPSQTVPQSSTAENIITETNEKKEVVAEVNSTTKTIDNQPDNAFDGTSLIGTVIKSLFGGVLDFFRNLFGSKK